MLRFPTSEKPAWLLCEKWDLANCHDKITSFAFSRTCINNNGEIFFFYFGHSSLSNVYGFFFWWFFNSKFDLPYRLYPPIFTSVLKETLLVKMNYSWSTQLGTQFNIPIEAKQDGNVLVFPIKKPKTSTMYE